MDSHLKSTLALVQRSPDQGDGWRTVSAACWPLVKHTPLDLLEIEPAEKGGRVRLTPEGKAVLKYG